MPHGEGLCSLCGLMCSLDEVTVDNHTTQVTSLCSRRTKWLSQPSGLSLSGRPRGIETVARQLTQLFGRNQKPLIWIDAADVNTVRAAVQLAQTAHATIHVGQSTGSRSAHRILTTEGWIGTSLAEVATHADLIVTLGTSILSEAPLLRARFLAPAIDNRQAEWCHIGDDPSCTSGATAFVHWPRSQWYKQLTELLLSLQQSPGEDRQEPGLKREQAGRALLDKLRRAKSIVWLWDAEEFCDSIDELCIRRLLGIARQLSLHTRCSLLRLDAQVGRITGEETLLWLTGFAPTASFNGQSWRCPQHLERTRLEDWQRDFDSILLIRTVPTPTPLPRLLATHYLLQHYEAKPVGTTINSVTPVGCVGVDRPGHLWRGDRATVMLCGATTRQTDSTLLAADNVLLRTRQLLVGEDCDAN